MTENREKFIYGSLGVSSFSLQPEG